MERTACPICLEFIDTTDAGNFLSVPGCQHKMHVACALECAHHGTRCPVCRHEFIQENVAPDPDAENNILFRFEQELQERAAAYRVYQMHRSRLIRRHNSLKKLRDRLRDANRSYAQADRVFSALDASASRRSASWARRTLAAATRRMASVILRVFLTDLIRSRISLRFAMA